MKLASSHSRFLLLLALVFIGASWYFMSYDEMTGANSGITKGEAPSREGQAVVQEVRQNITDDPAVQAGFVPHKALYDVRLVSTKGGSQIVNLDGQMLYEWQSSCGGWLSNHQFNLLYDYADTPPMQITSDFSTFESFDGQSFDFTSQRKRGGQLFEEIRGRATIGEDSGGEAVYSMPDGLAFDLPENALFPMRHTLEVFRNIQQGKRFFKATIFDGSDEDGPVEINTFIGNPSIGMADVQPSANLDTSLLNTKSWMVRLAFFPLLNPEAPADYEMTIHFHENSVISEMEIEYEDFTVRQSLIALEKMESGCDTPEESP